MDGLTREDAETLDLGELLAWMKEHGSSVELNWIEDEPSWECSWITGGTQFVGRGDTPIRAARSSILKAIMAQEGR